MAAKIKRNKAKCLNCQQILDVTDLPASQVLVCNCHNLRLSGGRDYVDTSGSNPAFGLAMTEWEDE